MKKVIFCALAVLLTACGADKPAPAQDSKAQEAPKTQAPSGEKIRIATESSFKPFSYLDNQGNLVGFEIDLANAMCREMKAECEITSQDWDGLIPSLQAGQFDAVMAGMSATDERRQVVDFSEPYFNNTLVLVAKKDKETSIKDIDGKNVAVQQATVSAKYLADNHPKAIIKAYDKQDNAYLDLTAGRADFMLSDIVPMLDWLKTEQGVNFAVKGEPIDINDKVAVAIKKDDSATLNQFNTALASLKQTGEYDKIVAKYFDLQAMGIKPTQSTTKE